MLQVFVNPIYTHQQICKAVLAEMLVQQWFLLKINYEYF